MSGVCEEMKKKMLYIENVASIKATNFYYTAFLASQDCGYEFHLAYNAYDATPEAIAELARRKIFFHQIDFYRNPFCIKNIKAFRQLKKLINEEGFDFVHCNTPIGGIIGRIVANKKVRTIVYQAHGFHFFKGAPLHYWLIFYPIERFFAHFTDVLLTINNEDYNRSLSFKLRKNGFKKYIPGVGIDLEYFTNLKRGSNNDYRKQFGLNINDFIIVSVGDLIRRKNNEVIIKAISLLNNPSVHFLICGKGPEEDRLKRLAMNYRVNDQIHFLGYRSDVKEILCLSDVFVLASYQEGLPRSLMEAMAIGLPCVASRIRGNNDLMESDSKFLFDPNNPDELKRIIDYLLENRGDIATIGLANRKRIEPFSIHASHQALRDTYLRI